MRPLTGVASHEMDACARRALTPFAEGEYGNYRRDDARRLLTVLDQRDR